VGTKIVADYWLEQSIATDSEFMFGQPNAVNVMQNTLTNIHQSKQKLNGHFSGKCGDECTEDQYMSEAVLVMFHTMQHTGISNLL